MSKGVNKVILIGNVGSIDVRATQTGDSIVNISLATSEAWTDKSGQKKESTEWHKITFFGKLAEIVSTWVKKGSKLYVSGSLRTRKWQDKDGSDRYSTEIVAREMQMLDGKPSQAQAPQAQAPQAQAQQMPANLEDFDDDIPF